MNQLIKQFSRIGSGLLLSSTLLACGGNDDISTQEDISREALSSFCDAQVTCNTYPDKKTCLASKSFDSSQTIAEEEAGLLEFNASKGDDCVNTLKEEFSQCNILGANPKATIACDAIFSGTIEVGKPCFSNESCKGQATCFGASEDASCGKGVCTLLAQAGADCSEATCENGLYCGVGKKCTPLLEAGASCELGQEKCVFNHLCLAGKCATLPGKGETCVSLCNKNTLRCDSSDKKCKERVKVGSTCIATEIQPCVAYADCLKGKCVAKAQLNQPCVIDEETHKGNCLGSLVCKDNKCTEPKAQKVCQE